MLILMYAGVLNGLIFKRLLTGKYFGLLAPIFITSIAYYFLYYVMVFLIWGQGNLVHGITHVMLIAAVYNTLICVPIYLLTKKWYKATT